MMQAEPAAAPPPDFTVAMMSATVVVDQPIANGQRQVGTAFLVSAPRPDGSPRTVLVTANHVLERMPGPEMRIGWRFQVPGGAWRFEQRPVTIRVGTARRWVKHPQEDVAAMEIAAPPEYARAAVPLAWLADEDGFARADVGPGDETYTLGFPGGLASNQSGFPILRPGRIASYPLAPVRSYPAFLVDLRIYPGVSGGPVFIPAPRWSRSAPLVAGLIARQTERNGQTYELAIVMHAQLIRETIARLDQAAPARPSQTGS